MKRLVLLLLPLTAFAAAPTADWSPNLTSTVAWVNNITHGGAAWDRIGALQLSADAVASSEYRLGRMDAAHVTVHFAGDWVPRFDRLADAMGGARLDWSHTFGEDSFAPIFTIEGAGDAVYAYEKQRRGFASSVTLKLSKRFGTAWRATVSHRFERYEAQHPVFDGTGSETTIEVGCDINLSTRMLVSARYRDGDIVTYAQYDRPDLEAIARTWVPLRTFDRPMKAYSAQAETIAGRAALVHATAENAALILAYEYAQSTGTANLKFANQIVSLSFVHQY